MDWMIYILLPFTAITFLGAIYVFRYIDEHNIKSLGIMDLFDKRRQAIFKNIIADVKNDPDGWQVRVDDGYECTKSMSYKPKKLVVNLLRNEIYNETSDMRALVRLRIDMTFFEYRKMHKMYKKLITHFENKKKDEALDKIYQVSSGFTEL